MPRLTKLDDVLFPVMEYPVFASIKTNQTEQRLPVPDKKAINTDKHRVLAIVGRSYRLVTNREALDWARLCCRTVFPETKPGEWEVQATDAPSTAGYCHIDLVHNSSALDFEFVPAAQRPEAFGPFIRVTNSYNGLRALGFDIGFYRKVCKNGMIVPGTIIRFHFTHLRRDIGATIQFKIAQDRLAKFKVAFTDALAGLRNCTVPRPMFEPLIQGVLLLGPPHPVEPDSHETSDWQTLSGHITEMSNRYAGELGENAYAVFNAVTEFASHPPENRCVHRDRHSYQRLAGSWLTSFNHACGKQGFSIASHLVQLGNERAETQNHRFAHSPPNGSD